MKLFILAAVVLAVSSQGYDRARWCANCGTTKYSDAYSNLPFRGKDGKIVGGRTAREGEAPWQVMLENFGAFSCGGSILCNDWVVTAAHCVGGAAWQYQVVVGEHSRDSPRGVVHNVSEVYVHPQYDVAASNDADIALLKMVRPIEFNDDTRPVCAPNPDADSRPYVGSRDIVISGWGGLWSGGPTARVLQVADDSPVVGNAECDESYPNSITPGMICGGKDGQRDTCQGDSGGPFAHLVNRNTAGMQAELIGITSWGRGCAELDYPGVYARVAAYDSWIETCMRTNGGTCPSQ